MRPRENEAEFKKMLGPAANARQSCNFAAYGTFVIDENSFCALLGRAMQQLAVLVGLIRNVPQVLFPSFFFLLPVEYDLFSSFRSRLMTFMFALFLTRARGKKL